MGVDLDVLADGWVSSLSDLIAVVANELLVLSGHVNNHVALTLDIGISWLQILGALIAIPSNDADLLVPWLSKELFTLERAAVEVGLRGGAHDLATDATLELRGLSEVEATVALASVGLLGLLPGGDADCESGKSNCEVGQHGLIIFCL